MKHIGNAAAVTALRAHAQRWAGLKLADQISLDPHARAQMSVSASALQLDFSRQRLDQAVLADLLKLAQECALPQAIQAMCRGEVLNCGEHRQVLHMALRASFCAEAAGVDAQVQAERARLQDFVEAVHAGKLLAPDGQAYTDVINIGIGGSDLGPRLVVDALAGMPGYTPRLRGHFLGNPDSAEIAVRLADLDPRRCLCVLASKSFTTAETHAVAEYLRGWLRAGGAQPEAQFVAVTAAAERAQAAGIEADRQFQMWDWVGGRFSLWSSVGLSIALVLGWPVFQALLDGAADMDAHFAEQPPESNLPIIWALLGIWNRNFLGLSSQVTAVYSDRLGALPDWLQQLDMESNGKAVGRDGETLAHATSPVHWGGVGTSVQHAFFQMLHQGAEDHAVDFVLPRVVPGMDHAMQRQLLANALGQSAALCHGRDGRGGDRDAAAAAAWRACPGNRPSSLLWLQQLDAHGLGQLLAAYEHRCFVQGWLWGINSFDQFGVELGKQLAQGIEAGLEGDQQAWPDQLAAQQAQMLRF